MRWNYSSIPKLQGLHNYLTIANGHWYTSESQRATQQWELPLHMRKLALKGWKFLYHLIWHFEWHHLYEIANRTRRSENDNTPQPLDQWTNSSFIGQQVGNCKSFTLTHYFADLSAMHRGRRSIPLCIQHHIQLTSLSFQVSQTSHCWVTAISIFYLENPRSRSWVRSKFEVTMWV